MNPLKQGFNKNKSKTAHHFMEKKTSHPFLQHKDLCLCCIFLGRFPSPL